ncbi:hypothetical protein JCM15519_23040 [Fundidesulfovibrio butyratiphilus]
MPERAWGSGPGTTLTPQTHSDMIYHPALKLTGRCEIQRSGRRRVRKPKETKGAVLIPTPFVLFQAGATSFLGLASAKTPTDQKRRIGLGRGWPEVATLLLSDNPGWLKGIAAN